MNSEFYRRFARQCRELGLRARTQVVREQLLLWAEEFEAQAAAAGECNPAKEQSSEASDGDG